MKNYLEVKFHDNDFTSDILNALDKLFDWITIQKTHFSTERTVAEMFHILNNGKILEPMIRKIVTLNASGHDVEWATRGLYSKDHTVNDTIKPASENVKDLEEYFEDLTIEFHADNDMINTDENGEHCILNMETGEIFEF